MSALSTAFDAVADRHDQARWESTPSPVDAAVWTALTELAGRDLAPALFLGSGSAREALSFVTAGHAATFVDVSPRMLQLARARYRGHRNIEYRLQSAESFLRNPGTPRFGHVCAIGELLGYVDEPQRLLVDIRTVLSPHGTVVFSWVDGDRIAAHAQSESVRGDDAVVTIVERTEPPLTIKAWSCQRMASLIGASGFSLVEEIASEESPRRSWIVVRDRDSADR
jgi:SAM-dependent methyltransferase